MKILSALLALSLCACASVPSIPTTSPAPLASTTIDDTALSAAWQGFDAALDAIDLLQNPALPSAIRLTPGTPRAVKVADAIDRVTAFLTAAEAAAAAGSTTSYKQALSNAKVALAELRTALRSN
jgi:hypothetical protein